MKFFHLFLLFAVTVTPHVASGTEIDVERLRSALRMFVTENRATIEKKVPTLYLRDSCGSSGEKTVRPEKDLLCVGSWLVASREGFALARYEYRSWGTSEGRRIEHTEGVEITLRESPTAISVESWKFL